MLDALAVFWAWWRDQLLDLVPGQAQRRADRADDGIMLSDPDGAAISVSERHAGAEPAATRIALDPAATEPVRQAAARRHWPLVLRLPGALLLERDVALPLAAERDIARVIFHEMDRFTPFAASEVFWSWALLARDRAHDRLRLRLSLVPRGPIAALLMELGAAGLPPAQLELSGQDGLPRRIALDAAADGGTGGDRLAGLAWAACVVLALLAVAVPFLMQARATGVVEARIAALTPITARVQRLRLQASAGSTGAEVVAAEHRRAGNALEAIALLTDALPDNTYLTALTFDAGKLTMDGQSKAAAALIAPLTANKRLADASFTAPVIRNTLGNDTFSMRLRVIP